MGETGDNSLVGESDDDPLIGDSGDGRMMGVLGVALIGSITAVSAQQLVNGSVSASTVVISVGAFVLALWPLCSPDPWAPLRRAKLVAGRVAVAVGVLAIAGSLGMTFVLDPTPLVLSGGVLAIAFPAWLGLLDRRRSPERTLVVGDDPALIRNAIRSVPERPVGFCSPVLSDPDRISNEDVGPQWLDRISTSDSIHTGSLGRDGDPVADGGRAAQVDDVGGIERIGGLSRLDDALCDARADTVVLAFRHADREEFFGTLRRCRERGLDVLAHYSLRERLLVVDDGPGALVEVDVEPWPWYSRAAKRAFDVAFAAVGLLVLAPVIFAIAAAIKLDSPGPVFYRQERTARFGETFTVAKFRSMAANAEEETGARLSDEDAGGIDPRVTRVGRILRKTHLDEIPQLTSVLVGDMSVVGPRPERPSLESELKQDGLRWEKRWLLKPGLTGLAQINEATSAEPDEKLFYDLLYVENQSLRYDCKIVAVQLWIVFTDVASLVSRKVFSTS